MIVRIKSRWFVRRLFNVIMCWKIVDASETTAINALREVQLLVCLLPRQSRTYSREKFRSRWMYDVATALQRQQQRQEPYVWKGKLGFARESTGNNLRARYDSRHDQPRDLHGNRNWLGRFYSGPPKQSVKYNSYTTITPVVLFHPKIIGFGCQKRITNYNNKLAEISI